MAVSSPEPHLAAIPETAPMNDLPGSARASPRSTSDSPARGTAPISPTSRLLRPTLSWQAKASWIRELPSGTIPTGTDSHVSSSSQGQEPMAAVHTRDLATMAASQLSPSPPSAGWQSIQGPLQTSHAAAGNARNMTTSMAQQPSNGLVAQEKADQLTSLLQDELAKRGKPSVTPWQQQRLQLRAVKRQSGSPAAQGSSPDHFRYIDASVDSLQQQRAKLKPLQTSKHAALPASLQQGFATAPALLPTGAANLRGVHPRTAALPAAGTGTAPAVRAPPAAPADVDSAATSQLGQAQPVVSPASQLRTKYGQLTDLLQSTALQRGISLSQVPIPPTHKPGKDQHKRVSLEEVRTSFRSFTTTSSAAGSSKPAPLRRVSTGTITVAFLKEKDKQDKALLESLGVADAAAEGGSDAAVAVDVAATPTWAPKQRNRTDLVDETPVVATRGKGYGRPTGNSFDIKVLEMQDEVSCRAEADVSGTDTTGAGPDTTGAAQAVAQMADSNGGVTHDTHSHYRKAGAAVEATMIPSSGASGVGPVKLSQATQAKLLDAQLQALRERPGDPHAAGVIAKDGVPMPQQVQQAETFGEIKKVQMTKVAEQHGINSSSVVVDITLAQHSTDKTKKADNTGQQSDGAQSPLKHEERSTASRGFGCRVCCFCCSTKE